MFLFHEPNVLFIINVFQNQQPTATKPATTASTSATAASAPPTKKEYDACRVQVYNYYNYN